MSVHVVKNFLIATVALGGAVAALPAPAAATVLDFSGAICTSDPCANGGTILQSYGDGAGVDVNYASYNYPAGTLFQPDLIYWDAAYGDLHGVVWGGADSVSSSSRITLTALPGYEISLLSFDIATYLANSASSPVLIESLGGSSILAAEIPTLWPLHNHVGVNSAWFTDGIALNWGPDGFNVGLDNIAFEVRAITGGPVPEPATWAMLILGFAAVGDTLRRTARARRIPART